MDQFNRNALARPPLGVEKEEQQLVAWKSLIAWEKTNPLQLEAYASRVMFTYRQAFMALRFYPEIWVDAATYLYEIGQAEEAVNIFKQGTEALPSNLLLHFSYAEFEEMRKRNPEARAIFETLLAQTVREREALQNDLEKEQRAEKEREKERHKQKDKDREKEKDEKPLSSEAGEDAAERLQQLEEELKKKMEQESLIYVMFMRFSKRAEDEQSLRNVFRRARESPSCTHHVFVASAYMQPTKQVVCNIFEYGLKKFATEPDYVLHYIDYLWHLKEDSSQNLRSLFERTLAVMPSEKARTIWQRYLEYELNNGDLSSVKKVEERLQAAYPGEAFGVLAIIERYKYLDLLPCSQREYDIYAKLGRRATASDLQSNLDQLRSLHSVNQQLIDKAKFPRPNMELLVKYSPESLPKVPQHPVSEQQGPPPHLGGPAPHLGGPPPQLGGPAPQLGGPAPVVVPQLPPVPVPLPPAPPQIFQMLPMEALGVFMTMLPPATAFQGTDLNVGELMGLVLRAQFPTQVALPPVTVSPPVGPPQPFYGDMRDDGGYGGPKRKYEEEMGGPYGREPHPGRRGYQ